MTAALAAISLVDSGCPLCGARVLAVGRGGRVTTRETHPVGFGGSRAGEGYLLCEDCGTLADEANADLTIN